MLLRKENKKPGYFDFWKPIIPSEDEVKYLSFANQDCFYYYKGISECRQTIMKDPSISEKSFVPCARVVDEYHKCITHSKLGGIKDLEEEDRNLF